MKRDERVDLLREHGSQSVQYRRAWRTEYRRMNRRIDYTPDRAALAALDMALERGWAASYTDAINRALSDWVKE